MDDGSDHTGAINQPTSEEDAAAAASQQAAADAASDRAQRLAAAHALIAEEAAATAAAELQKLAPIADVPDFVIPSGNIGSIRIPEKLTELNYPIWRDAMRFLLQTQNLWPAIEPPPGRVFPRYLQERFDTLAIALIGLSVSNCFYIKFKHLKSARQVWDTLEAYFKSKNLARQTSYHRELVNIRQLKGEDVTTYFTRAERIKEKLDDIGYPVADFNFKDNVIFGLDQAYASMRGPLQLQYLNDSVTLNHMLPQLQAFESRNFDRSRSDEPHRGHA